MTGFVVRPISSDVAREVRSSRQAPEYGHPVHAELARGTGPCRICLRAFAVGVDDRLLFTYSPFDRTHTLAQPGPVFIHADDCEPHRGSEYPAGLRGIEIVVQPHNRDGSAGAPRKLLDGEEATMLAAVLADENVAFAHLRHGQAGCFIARVDRAHAAALATTLYGAA